MITRTKKVQKRLIDSARTDSKRVHITPRPNGWAIRKEGNFRASAVTKTQKMAIELASNWIVEGTATAIIVHSTNGKFRAAR